jgi:hypothetical protein
MSHFSVLVALKEATEEALEAALQPFHEYECTDINDQYVVFVPADESTAELTDKHKSDLKEYPDCTKQDLGQYLQEDYGYELRNGVWGRETNPNAKWDWWRVGGRWSNFLSLKDGNKADDSQKKDIDFDGMKQDAANEAEITYDKIAAVTDDRTWVSWEQSRKDHDSIDDAREFYNSQPAIIDIKQKFDNPFMDKDVFLKSREDYIDSKKRSAVTTFATLVDGKWAAKGEMGWWACVSGEVADWPTDFQRIIDSVPDDHHLVVVDCHI